MLPILLDEARRRFEYEDAWWRANRDLVDLFVDEFEQTLERICAAPDLGQVYRPRGVIVHRWLMPKTRCHIYYVIDRAQNVIEVHSVWGAHRERGPAL